jgi:formylmethanofuran dehydrogenase subunit E
MECKGCSKEFAESELKKVGLWHFCSPCFEELLTDAAAPKPEPVSEPEPESPPLVLKGEQAKCTVCDAPLEDGAGHDMGILTVCTACYQEMIARPEPVKINVAEPEEEVAEDEEPGLPLPDPMETVPCIECGRTIRKIAAKVFYDKPYCPDCYYKNDFQNFKG